MRQPLAPVTPPEAVWLATDGVGQLIAWRALDSRDDIPYLPPLRRPSVNVVRGGGNTLLVLPVNDVTFTLPVAVDTLTGCDEATGIRDASRPHPAPMVAGA